MSQLPKWVNTILTNEFEDDPYWETGIEQEIPEAFYALTNIQKAPSDIHVFMQARHIYEKYIDEVINYYGGMENIRQYLEENGQYPPGYSDPPKLSLSKKTNRAILRSGVIPQKEGVYNRILDGEDMSDLGEKMYPSTTDAEDLQFVTPKGKLKKRLQKKYRKSVSSGRIDTMSTNVYAAGFDIISQYYKNNHSDNPETDDEVFLKKSYGELARMYDEEAKERENGWTYDIEFVNGLGFKNDRLLSRKLYTEIESMRALSENGFNPLKGRKKKYTPDELKRIRTELGINVLSKKDIKKQNKEFKRYEKGLTKHSDSFRSLSQTLSRNSRGMSLGDEKIFDEIVRRRK